MTQFIFIIMYLQFSSAQEFSFEGKPVILEAYPETKGWVTPGCIDRKKPPFCKLLLALKAASYRNLDLGEDDPGAVVCEVQFKGRFEIYLTQNRSQLGICRFPDQTVVDTGTLSYKAQENDELGRIKPQKK